VDKYLLNKFEKGQCSKKELRYVLKWYQSNNAEVEFAQKIESLWGAYSEYFAKSEFNEDEVWNKIANNTYRSSKSSGSGLMTYSIKPRTSNISPYFAAASIVLLIGVVMGFLALHGHLPFEMDKDMANLTVTKSTSKGQKTTIFLSDGSKVKLNANSKLTFPESFSENKREVYLEGEAFFEVYADETKPFIVHTGPVTTTALGTAFNINAYEAGKEIKVALAEGKVVVQTKRNPNENAHSEPGGVVLEPGNQVLYNVINSGMVNEPFNSKQILSWKDDILYFEDASWYEIIHTLENWYGVNIETVNKGNSEKLYSGEFDKQSLHNVLESMSFTKDFDFKIEEKYVLIDFGN